jgi:hypothetical protein
MEATKTMKDPYAATFTLQLTPPIGFPNAQPITVQMHMASREFSESFAPLPRDHDLPLVGSDAARQKHLRRQFAEHITLQLVAKLLEAAAATDPVRGEYPEHHPLPYPHPFPK